MKCKIVLTALAMVLGTQSALAGVSIGGGAGYILQGTAKQRFSDYITIAPGDEEQAMKLKIQNGVNGPKWNWLRVTLGGRTIITDDGFGGKDEVIFPLSGNIGAGSTQIIMEGAGPQGGSIGWQIVSELNPVAKAIQPDEATPGQQVQVSGKDFSKIISKNKVTVAGKEADIKLAQTDRIDFVVPDVKPGDADVIVQSRGVKTKAVKLKVRGKPELSGMSLMSAPGGQEITITGKNFSKNASENQVLFDGIAAQITSSSPESITCIVPDFGDDYPRNVTITVKVADVQAKESLVLLVSARVY